MDLGIPELLIILVIVVLLFGPGRLSKIGGELGSGISAFRRGLTTEEKDDEDATEKEIREEAEPVVPVTAGPNHSIEGDEIRK